MFFKIFLILLRLSDVELTRHVCVLKLGSFRGAGPWLHNILY